MTATPIAELAGVRIEPLGGARSVVLATQRIERPIAEVFDFFADAGNLEALTPSWLNFQILTPLPIEMRAGAEIRYRIRLHGISISWRTEISTWEPGVRFVDEQRSGPYKVWHHEHTFEADGDGATLVHDRVEYVPRGGRLANALLVRRDVRRIFKYRQAELARRFS